MNGPTPEKIIEVGMGFMGTKTLLSAVELGLFTTLGDKAMTEADLRKALGLDPRASFDFFDGLVALGFLAREGDGAAGRYRNTPETALFLDKAKPSYVGGILEMANARLYPFWADLTAALKTGKPQNEVKSGGKGLFEQLYAEPARLEQFVNAMSGISYGPSMAFGQAFDFSKYKTMCDVGGAAGMLSCCVARAQPHMACVTADLPKVTDIARRNIAAQGLSSRVTAQDLDFFNDALPKADVITMSHILHDWGRDTQKMLAAKAYAALPTGGAFCAIESTIDDTRRTVVPALMMSLNMLIETPDGFNFSHAHFASLAKEAGFSRTAVVPLTGPMAALCAYK